MYKVLIVEDEMLVRSGIKNSINWKKYNMEVVADASDGTSAFEIYKKEAPDLILTDIKMPGMDGLELISKIRENDQTTRIIILSCLEEFELVRRAMSLGVSDYILKLTMTEEETETVLKKAQTELNKLCKQDNARHIPTTDINKDRLLKDFLFNGTYTAEEFNQYVLKLKLRLNQTRMVLCNMEIAHYELLKTRFRDETGQKIKLSVSNTLDDLLDTFKKGTSFYDKDRNYILIFNFNDLHSEQAIYLELSKILNSVRNALKTFYNIDVSFGISSIQNRYSSLLSMYKEASQALEQKFFLGDGIIFPDRLKECGSIITGKAEMLRQLTVLTRHLDKETSEEYNRKIDRLINKISGDAGQIRDFFSELLQWTTAALHLKGEHFNMAIILNIQKLLKCETLDEIIQVYKSFLSEITENVMKNRTLSNEISETLNYIRLNYNKDISLQQIAEYVKLSPAYVSNLFKKELHVNFVEYLNQVRVERAKELLLDTRLKSYEIAEKVGFTEETYFSKVFKKYTGESPNEFRKKWMESGKDT